MSKRLVQPTRVICLLLFASCASPDTGGSRAAQTEDATTATVLPSIDGMIVLDRSEGRVLAGQLEPIVPNADPDRVVVLESADRALDGQRVLDARFAADAIVLVGADHVLRAYRNGAFTELDQGAELPLSVAGSTVVYARGEMPFFEIARADVVRGGAEVITDGMAPAYSPAISADGSTIVFTSTVSGAPRLYRFTGGRVEPLPVSARTPSSPIAPRLEGDRLAFEDEEGTAVVDLRTGLEVAQ